MPTTGLNSDKQNLTYLCYLYKATTAMTVILTSHWSKIMLLSCHIYNTKQRKNKPRLNTAKTVLLNISTEDAICGGSIKNKGIVGPYM